MRCAGMSASVRSQGIGGLRAVIVKWALIDPTQTLSVFGTDLRHMPSSPMMKLDQAEPNFDRDLSASRASVITVTSATDRMSVI